jgi:hypothetical protein
MDLMRRAIDIRNERDNAKTKKGRVAADAKLAGLSDLGITGGFVEALSNIKDFNGFLERFNAAQKDVPPQTDTQKTKEQLLAEEMGKTAAAARGLGTALTDSIGEGLRQFGPSLETLTESMRKASEAVKGFADQVAAFAANPLQYIAKKTAEATGLDKAPRSEYGRLLDEVREEKRAKAEESRRIEAEAPARAAKAEEDRRGTIVSDFAKHIGQMLEKRQGAGGEGSTPYTRLLEDLNRQSVAGLNRDFGLGRSSEPQKVEAEAKIDVQSQVSVRVEPSSELLKVIANAKTMGAQMGAMIAKSANTATAGATAP